MVTHRQVQPVGLEGIVHSAEHDANIGGVFATAVEVYHTVTTVSITIK